MSLARRMEMEDAVCRGISVPGLVIALVIQKDTITEEDVRTALGSIRVVQSTA